MTRRAKALAIAVLVGTLGIPLTLRYGTLPMFVSYITAFITVSMVLGEWWLWNSAPTVDSAKAIRTLMRGLWTASGVLAGVAIAAGLRFSNSTFLLLPLPFFLPALSGSIFYGWTFGKVGNLPFWKKGL